MSDWENDSDTPATAPATITNLRGLPTRRWEGEDGEESVPASDWEDSSEEEEKPKPAPVAPPKKKGTVKAKIAENEAARAARAAAGEDLDYDEDAVLDPRERARLNREKELQSDMDNAASLLGAASIGGVNFPARNRTGGSSSKELDALLFFEPRNKEDWHGFSAKIIELITARLQDKPLYPTFVEYHARQLAQSLKDTEIRKAASGLTTLANEKQKEQRDKVAGKKKPKAATKLVWGSAKALNKFDTETYDEALDDFGANADDFM